MSKFINPEKAKSDMYSNPFPNEHVDPKIKASDDFGTKVARAILYRHNYYSSTINRIAKIQENRYYANGRQDVDKYKPRFDSYMDAKNASSLVNLDWSIEPIAPAIINRLIGQMINQDHKIQLNSIDPQAKTEWAEKRDELYGNLIQEQELAILEQMAGADLFPKKVGYPTNPEEIEVYMDMEYRQPIEIAFEEIIDYELMKNDFKMIRNQVIRDLVENNKGIVRRYWDANNDIRLRWVDLQNYITSNTTDPRHRDVEYQAELCEMTVREIRKLGEGKIPEEKLFQMAKDAANRYDSNKWLYGSRYNVSGSYNGHEYAYDDYRVQVLDFVFYTTDLEVYEKKEKKSGGFYMNKKSFDYEVPKKSKHKKERIDKQYRMAYSGMWAVDSNTMIRYGKERNMVRPEDPAAERDLDPNLIKNFIVIEPNIREGESTSIVDLMKPTLDEMQLLVLKMRHIVAEAAPPGVAIDISAINNLQLGTDGVTPEEVLAMWKNKGIMLYDGEDDSGNQMNRKPVEELVNGVQGALQPLVAQWMFKMETLRHVTGTTAASDGTTPDKDSLVGIQKLMTIASNNATREIYQAYLDGILQPVGEALVPMIKTKIQFLDGIKEYENVIGREGVRSIELTPKRVKLCRLGVKVEALPDGEDLERLDQHIARSLEKDQIRLEDAIEIRRVLNPKKAERYLIYKRNKYDQEKLEQLRIKEEMTAQREANSAMAAAEAEKIKQAAAAEKEIAVVQAKAVAEKELDDHKTINKLKVVDREGYWKERLVEEAESAGDTGIDANNDGKGGGGGSRPGMPKPFTGPRVKIHPVKAAKRIG